MENTTKLNLERTHKVWFMKTQAIISIPEDLRKSFNISKENKTNLIIDWNTVKLTQTQTTKIVGGIKNGNERIKKRA